VLHYIVRGAADTGCKRDNDATTQRRNTLKLQPRQNETPRRQRNDNDNDNDNDNERTQLPPISNRQHAVSSEQVSEPASQPGVSE